MKASLQVAALLAVLAGCTPSAPPVEQPAAPAQVTVLEIKAPAPSAVPPTASTEPSPSSAPPPAEQPAAPTAGPGRLPPEVIQAVVRSKFKFLRRCYEEGLLKAPGLDGKILVRFVIGEDGLVKQAVDAGSTMPDKTVVSCVIKGFMALRFPKPENGIVTVNYPIIFSPGDGP